MNALAKSDLTTQEPDLVLEIAETPEQIMESLRLRYEVFSRELGATVEGSEQGIDRDHYDDYAIHLLARDMNTGRVAGSTRLMTNEIAAKAGGFYAASEFDLSQLDKVPGRKLEVGRTCVHADYRKGSAIAVLWGGVCTALADMDAQYMFGCASIPLDADLMNGQRALARIREMGMHPDITVVPRVALPEPDAPVKPGALPPLLKAYIRLGAIICGDLFWDKDFNVADAFILIDPRTMNPDYSRHFVQRNAKD